MKSSPRKETISRNQQAAHRGSSTQLNLYPPRRTHQKRKKTYKQKQSSDENNQTIINLASKLYIGKKPASDDEPTAQETKQETLFESYCMLLAYKIRWCVLSQMK